MWECGNRFAISMTGGKDGKPAFGFPGFPRAVISTSFGVGYWRLSWTAHFRLEQLQPRGRSLECDGLGPDLRGVALPLSSSDGNRYSRDERRRRRRYIDLRRHLDKSMYSQHRRSCPPIASGRYLWRTDGIGDCVRSSRLPTRNHRPGRFWDFHCIHRRLSPCAV